MIALEWCELLIWLQKQKLEIMIFDLWIQLLVVNRLCNIEGHLYRFLSLLHQYFVQCRNDQQKRLVLKKYKQRTLPLERREKRLQLQRVSRVEGRLRFTELHARCVWFLPQAFIYGTVLMCLVLCYLSSGQQKCLIWLSNLKDFSLYMWLSVAFL